MKRIVMYTVVLIAGLLLFCCEDNSTNNNGNGDINVNGIYIAVGGNNRIIFMDDMTGAGWIAYGDSGSGIGKFIKPSGIDIGQDGKIYVVDGGNDRIVRIDDMSGSGWVTYEIEGDGEGEFDFSWDSGRIVIGSDGKIYILDNRNNRVVRIDDMTGTGWITYGTEGDGEGEFDWPFGIDVGDDNEIYIADYGNARIVRIDNMTGEGWVSYNFGNPFNVALGPNGKIYMLSERGVIGRIDHMTGTGWGSFGSDSEELFDEPTCIDIGIDNRIYIVDDNSRVICIDDMSGSGWVEYGTDGSGIGEFDNSISIVVMP